MNCTRYLSRGLMCHVSICGVTWWCHMTMIASFLPQAGPRRAAPCHSGLLTSSHTQVHTQGCPSPHTHRPGHDVLHLVTLVPNEQSQASGLAFMRERFKQQAVATMAEVRFEAPVGAWAHACVLWAHGCVEHRP